VRRLLTRESPASNIPRARLVSYIVTQGIAGARANWQEQLRRGALDFAILLAVSPGPKYGLAIIQHLEQFTDLVVAEGTIYPILGRLTRDELLHAWWVEDEAPHARKYYRLTPAGKRRLTEMKAEWSAFTGKIDRLMRAAEGSIDAAQ
jgi:PadR family transcriptional regulator, regulatory protein PadR